MRRRRGCGCDIGQLPARHCELQSWGTTRRATHSRVAAPSNCRRAELERGCWTCLPRVRSEESRRHWVIFTGSSAARRPPHSLRAAGIQHRPPCCVDCTNYMSETYAHMAALQRNCEISPTVISAPCVCLPHSPMPIVAARQARMTQGNKAASHKPHQRLPHAADPPRPDLPTTRGET